MHASVCVHGCVCACVCVHVCKYVCVRACVCVHACVHVCELGAGGEQIDLVLCYVYCLHLQCLFLSCNDICVPMKNWQAKIYYTA